ncbi:MAG TPA: alkaline phosphatase family protein [Solirubrobacteraceae bacterium]|jgi:phospholipase C|nr:alkaline phosphatase family protein [Solirubrobacteraceae bacterium]
MRHKCIVPALLAALAVSGGSAIAAQSPSAGVAPTLAKASEPATTTPIKHVVIIFQENVSFDHYFGTYPNAANTDGQKFKAAKDTPAVDGLTPATDPSLPPSLRHSTNLLFTNPNAANPQRLDSNATGLPGDAGGQLTCDQDHNYSDEQQSFDGGAMDRFVQSVGTASGNSPFGAPCNPNTVMDYYDGNTLPALWNYAQHYSMSDDSFGTTFGPSAPGAINLVAGDTGEVDTSHMANSPSISTSTSPDADLTVDGNGGYSLTSDAQPYWDDCSTRDAVAMKGTNIGDALNSAGLSWGWFEGGFRPSTSYTEALAATGKAGQPDSTFTPDQFSSYFSNAEHRPAHSSNQNLCSAVHPVGVALGGTGQWGYKNDYIPHHEPFQYYASTANPHHLTVPSVGGQDTLSGLEQIGKDTQAYVGGAPQFNTPNHQYDTSDFNQLVEAINRRELPDTALPAVSFLKAPGYEDGHAAYSEPADEQQFITDEINALMRSPDWKNTVVMINYDDSDGWYDHVYSGVTNPSLSPADNLTNTHLNVSGESTSGQCGGNPQGTGETPTPLAGEQGRCGFGPRLPLLVISPFAKKNAVDHNLSDQASMINFVEHNWNLPGILGSADQVLAGKDAGEGVPFDLAGMFEFEGKKNGKLFLNPTTGQRQP